LVETRAYRPARNIFGDFRRWPKTSSDFALGKARLAAVTQPWPQSILFGQAALIIRQPVAVARDNSMACGICIHSATLAPHPSTVNILRPDAVFLSRKVFTLDTDSAHVA
jgi:hypothetical protein